MNTEQEARAIVMEKYPGAIEDVEYHGRGKYLYTIYALGSFTEGREPIGIAWSAGAAWRKAAKNVERGIPTIYHKGATV